MNFELGKTYVDKITGLKGVATGHVRYITGCNQVLIAPRADKDGNVPNSTWVDEQRLDEDPNQPQIVLDNSATPGPDKAAPIR